MHDMFSDNLPAFLTNINPGSRVIYLLCLLLIAGGIISLPLIRIQVSVTGNGIIRPLQEKANIIPITSGMVEKVYALEGDFVGMSDPILKVSSFAAAKNLQLLKMESRDLEQYLADLKGLLSDHVNIPAGQKFRTAYMEYYHHLDYLKLLHEKARREWSRQTELYNAGLISEKEYDDLAFSRNKTKQEMVRFKSETQHAWQAEYNLYHDRYRELTTEIRQTEEEIRITTIIAPVAGSLEEFSGIFPGSVVKAGDVIGVISPDSRLIGEIYMQSKDIAYVRLGQEVYIQVDAFPSREWGFITAEIYEISNDFIWINQQAVYRVKCHLPETGLVLRNGYKGELLKGMTFQARCIITPRSLLQLLTDKADDWLDPAYNNQPVSVSP